MLLIIFDTATDKIVFFIGPNKSFSPGLESNFVIRFLWFSLKASSCSLSNIPPSDFFMTVSSGLVTAAGYVSMLDEPDYGVKLGALRMLNQLVDEFWPEISEQISNIETMFEDSEFPDQELAALVGSKLYFHLEEFLQSFL